MPYVVMMGPQGAGKGTQADLLSKRIGAPHVSMGNLLRAEIKADTEIGRQIGDILKRGDLVPVEVTETVLERRFAGGPDRGFILDGYPRSPEQLEQLRRVLERLGKRLDHAVLINITDEEALKRLTGRRVCSNVDCELNYHAEYNPPKVDGVCDRCGSVLKIRKDDKPEAIRRRLELYHDETVKLIDVYRKWEILREIDGMHGIQEVADSICAAVCADGACSCK
jgi:adenylate kinase